MLFIFGLLLVFSLITWMRLERKKHEDKIRNLKVRVHVNGIRGKSSVTRLSAGVLRAGNYNTLAKVTGNSPNIINHEGEDFPIKRKGPANILEQVKIVQEHVDEKTDAIVLECMAIKPKFQKFLEEHIVNADINIITNIREDHMDELGSTLEEITENILSTLPTNGGYCISSEENPKLAKIISKKCKKKNVTFYNALNYPVSDSYLKKFKHVEHRSNIQIGLALADVLEIPESKALQEMLLVKPEKEVLTIKEFSFGNKKLIWSNMFSINDEASCIINLENVNEKITKEENVTQVCILNNRKDRPDRTLQFLELVTKKANFDLHITFGAFKDQVINHLQDHQKEIFTADDSLVLQNPEKFINQIFKQTDSKCVMLCGLMNIHTPQAESLIKYLENLESTK